MVFFIPAIVYLAGAIGTQTVAIAVRWLSMSQLSIRRLMVGELYTGAVIGLVLAVGVTFWGIAAFKKANNGLLSIGQGLKLGAGIALISGIIAIVYLIFLANVLDPEFASKVMDLRMAEAAEQQNLTSEQIQQGKEMGLKFWWFGYPVILIVNIIIGLIIGLVGGLIFKKAQPDY